MFDVATIASNLVFAGVAGVAALISAGLIALLLPWLRIHAIDRPNARSSHDVPTPQGGGAAVCVATLAAAWGGGAATHAFGAGELNQFLAVTGAAVLLAAVGAIDDIRGLAPFPRLVVQCAAVAAVIACLPADLRIAPMLPSLVERVGLFVGCVWFVNLTNFMDGIDWMTVVETVPVAGAIGILGLLGVVPPLPALVALALLGATLGFAPFNKPVAKLFLGDVGSLPIGLFLAWLLVEVATRGHVAAALLLPLYYFADATLTLLRRLLAGEPVWKAHRTHFYQIATHRGFTIREIVGRVLAVNLALAALALATIARPGLAVAALSLAAGCALVGWLLMSFSHGRRR